MTEELLNYAYRIKDRIDTIKETVDILDTIEEDSSVVALNDIIGKTGITATPSLRALTYDYVMKCRALLKQDLAEAERTFKEI